METPELIKTQIDLILSCGNYSLEEYSTALSDQVGDAKEDLEDVLPADNENIKNLHKALSSTEKSPCMFGLIGVHTILEASDYGHADYIGTHIWDDEVELCVFDNKTNELNNVGVSPESINVVSSFLESEVIATSTEIPGHYFIIYHDDTPMILSVSDDNFIKALASLSLIQSGAMLKALMLRLKKRGYKLSDPLDTVSRIISCNDGILSEIEYSSEEERESVNDLYWQWREGK